MKITAEPRSDQWNADDFIGGARTFTVAGATLGSAEQKYDIQLEGEARAWRPPLTVIRLLMAAWGDESDDWIGRRVTLYRDDSVRFGSDEIGGVRISHMSHLPGGRPLTVKLTSKRGRRQNHTVQPLPDEPAPRSAISDEQAVDFAQAIDQAATLDDLSNVVADMKSLDLGAHRESLLAAFTARRAAIDAVVVPE